MIIFPFFIHDSDPDPNSGPPSDKKFLLLTSLIFFAISGCLFIFACLLNYNETPDNEPQTITNFVTLVKILQWIGSGLSCLIGILSLIRFLIYDKVDRN